MSCRTTLEWGDREAQVGGYDWRLDAVKRAREHGCSVIEDFDRAEIFDRDRWTCYLCGIRCEQPDPYNRRAAPVDHVVAYANGGQHTRANSRTACLSCNSSKQASPVAA